MSAPNTSTTTTQIKRYDVVIIGAGSAGVTVAASLLKRQKDLAIAIIDPSDTHDYQPGWTLVGGGVFSAESTRRKTKSVIPECCSWYQKSAEQVDPHAQTVTLSDGASVGYSRLVVAPGLVLNWGAIKGLEETLGQNGVTSNYRYDLAPYTRSLVQGLHRGKAVFSQPPMPIKCAGAPQKAMYLSSDYWRKANRLKDIDVSFRLAGNVLFGVEDYVPALQHYIDLYGIDVGFGEQLASVDGANRTATFLRATSEGGQEEIEVNFDMLHAVPPQNAPAFIEKSGLANSGGWLDLDHETLQHAHFSNIFGLGDASGTPNAKTMAAVRKQAPVVAENLLASLHDQPLRAAYLGYGSCPLTVERGRIVLAEFGYGGALQPTFPKWVNDGTKATKQAWFLKTKQLPWIYWNGMLKGREWLAKPAERQS
ncbi:MULTISPECIES: FAD/NAD(P)-binding oxidoreductase [Marinobacter]|jgi:sulfide:quinone oxidoreductase|uniref:NAD(P)/FAD-dependent oxidoreductase n=1 Tax=Marinobacter TaxID=2742 RepID=UPI00294354E8|nr:FAD/NAD(P)-binding oxidoreductase [Marinobacter salarius]WOI20537.1 FAD/NAD(P)-binding oxidoreductase [Marinobacter salarius]